MDNLAYKYEDERPYEILNGVIYNMASPRFAHTRAAFRISVMFENFLKGKRCKVCPEHTDVFFENGDNVIPDMSVVCNPDLIKADGVHGAPDLIVEVLSPSTAKRDKGYKKDLYERNGVREYWIVDVNNRTVEVYLLKEGKYVIDNIYMIYNEQDLECMKDDEKAAIPTSFTTSLYGDDLVLQIADIFEE
ncbi:hypothetical protein AGMMS49975_17900 [Clostridia bacterium]|nr:hypothetical protein AGMMS49975_17900 [Clostridia bacterium]